MSTNAQIADLFDDIASVLELLGENPFRVAANAKVARVLRDLPADVASMRDDIKKLTSIDGIGKGSAEKIIEFLTTGKIREREELVAKIPPGLVRVLNIPGVGPKTVRLLWEKGGVTDLESLKAKLDSGELEKLPRLGAKTVQNIREALEFTAKGAERIRIGEALPVAERIVEHLRGLKLPTRIEYCGSLRRGAETIGDIDVLASTKDPAALAKAFTEIPGVVKVLASGGTKASVRLAEGVQVDLRIVDDSCFGAALLYFTGSKEHNIVLRERSIKMGYRLNEYGLFPAAKEGEDENVPPQKRGIKPVAGKTEESVYKKLGLPFIPPELRENRGEFDAPPPSLIEITDIKAELHAHTVASDGRMTIEELAGEAKRRGFHTVAVTDHSKSSVQANGLSPERLLAHIQAVRAAAKKIDGITVLAGSEVDILVSGKLDYDDELLAMLDIVIASPHASLRQEGAIATERILKAIRNPFVHIIGHPTGRIIGKRPGLPLDIPQIVAAAKEHDVALEINANYLRLDLRDTHVKAAIDAGVKIAIDTDAHTDDDFDQLRYGVLTARRGWVTPASCINTWPAAKLHKWLKTKR